VGDLQKQVIHTYLFSHIPKDRPVLQIKRQSHAGVRQARRYEPFPLLRFPLVLLQYMHILSHSTKSQMLRSSPFEFIFFDCRAARLSDCKLSAASVGSGNLPERRCKLEKKNEKGFGEINQRHYLRGCESSTFSPSRILPPRITAA
jgi:hypothetical protein